METQFRFSASDKMNFLITKDFSLLLVINRFDLPLGFGDSTVKEVCAANGIDCNTFLTVVNFLSEPAHDPEKTYEDIDLKSVIRYLKNSHDYFLDYKLPAIREKLLLLVDSSAETAPFRNVFLRFFDEYSTEVRRHMDYENKTVFPYAYNLIEGKTDEKYHISIFAQRHNQIDLKLIELKNILIKHYQFKGGNNLLTEVLFDIYMCEKDLASHCDVEDCLIIPAIKAIETKSR
jgi:regulator of cell morphogenesis and NO signaling